MQCFGINLETWCLYGVLFRQWLFYIIDKLQQLLCWCVDSLSEELNVVRRV